MLQPGASWRLVGPREDRGPCSWHRAAASFASAGSYTEARPTSSSGRGDTPVGGHGVGGGGSPDSSGCRGSPASESAALAQELRAARQMADGLRTELAEEHLAALPQCATWLWTDGSADGGVLNGGAGALVIRPEGEEAELRVPAGSLCSSFRAEMFALDAALKHMSKHLEDDPGDPVVVCTDSRSALTSLSMGPPAQSSPLAAAIWHALLGIAAAGRRVHLQWVPAHCDLAGNERADTLAKEASMLPQDEVPVDVRTIHRAASRAARARTRRERPQGWYRTLMGTSAPPPPVTGMSRTEAADVHQLRAGHWSGSAQYLHRIGRNPSARCEQCSSLDCRAGWCPICREEADTPRHILCRCPALMGTRLRLLGTIQPTMDQLRSDSVVAALAAAARSLQSRTATP